MPIDDAPRVGGNTKFVDANYSDIVRRLSREVTTTSIVSRGLEQLVALLIAVTPDGPGRATPCSEWTVTDLSDHKRPCRSLG